MKLKHWLFIGTISFFTGCPPSTDTSTARMTTIGTAMITSSAVSEPGAAVAVVFDTSGSMEGDRLAAAKKTFEDVIYPRFRAAKEPLDYSIVTCGGNAQVIQPNALFNGQSSAVISNLSAGGGTPLGESILEAYQQLSNSRRARKYIFILSDGQATGTSPEAIIRPMVEQGVDVGIYVVGFQSQRAYYDPIAALGGQVLMVEDANSLRSTCDAIFCRILKVEAE